MSVIVDRCNPVSVLVAVIVTPGTPARLSSVASPRMTTSADCDGDGAASEKADSDDADRSDDGAERHVSSTLRGPTKARHAGGAFLLAARRRNKGSATY